MVREGMKVQVDSRKDHVPLPSVFSGFSRVSGLDKLLNNAGGV